MAIPSLLALIGPLSFWELAIIMAVILIVFGPRNLPRLARAVGQAMREFRDAASRVGQSVGRELDEEDRAREHKHRSSKRPEEDAEAPPRSTGGDKPGQRKEPESGDLPSGETPSDSQRE